VGELSVSRYIKSDWFRGLLAAEQLRDQGWTFKSIDYFEETATWVLEGTEGVQVVFEEHGWLTGVLDYYKHLRGV
jgi:uncharacterized alpha-E superfamily protein